MSKINDFHSYFSLPFNLCDMKYLQVLKAGESIMDVGSENPYHLIKISVIWRCDSLDNPVNCLSLNILFYLIDGIL